MTGKTEYPKNTTAKITTFSGEIKTLAVEWVWYWNGEPLRVYGKDKDGKNYKFKMDEEPFTLHIEAPS